MQVTNTFFFFYIVFKKLLSQVFWEYTGNQPACLSVYLEICKFFEDGPVLKFILWSSVNSLPNDKILDSSKLKKFADDNFKFDENGRMCLKWVENTGKRSCLFRAISPFSAVFSKDLY